jgi:tRNA threonylcarbamoyl adenosine modification protein YeaZ
VHVLALDTATESTAVAVVDFDGDGHPTTRAGRAHVDPRAHGERLAPQIAAALAEAGAGPAALTAIVAGTGPGPFTGLRVGLATAAAMGQALGIPTYGVCSLDGIGSRTEGRALVATDARRREVYWAVYEAGVRVTEPAVDRPAEVRARAELAYGDGAIRYADVLGIPVAEAPRYPDPAALAVLAYDRIAAGKPGEVLTPRYLRRPDATPR